MVNRLGRLGQSDLVRKFWNSIAWEVDGVREQ